MQDVPQFLAKRGLTLDSYLDPRRKAVIDTEHCVRLNWESFFFADLWERERFLDDVVTYCGLLTDPVSRRRFRPTQESPRFSHAGVRYFFESADTREQFEAEPDKYRLPGWKM